MTSTPVPACPFCGSRKTRAGTRTRPTGRPEATHRFVKSWCNGRGCGKQWWGYWTHHEPKDAYPYTRWTIRVPVETVPWTQASIADLECLSRARFDFTPGVTEYHPNCCRWPKSCYAFDVEPVRGKGPIYFGWDGQPLDSWNGDA